MHDLRASVYAHLQRLSLAFFTRTRTGEVQSRIANDIGGVQTRRHVDGDVDRLERHDGHRDRVRDGCSWTGSSRSSRSPCCRVFVLLTRRVGACGARSRASSRARWPTSRRSSRSRSRSPACCSGKTMGQSDELTERFRGESAAAGRARAAAAHGRPLGDVVDPDDVRGHAGAHLRHRRPRHGRRAAPTSRWARWSPSRRCRRGCSSPSAALLSVQADVQSSLALFDRIFEYLDLPVDIEERRGPDRARRARTCAARCGSSTSSFAYEAGPAGRSQRRQLHGRARLEGRDRRRDRQRQDDARLPGRAALRRQRRARC